MEKDSPLCVPYALRLRNAGWRLMPACSTGDDAAILDRMIADVYVSEQQYFHSATSDDWAGDDDYFMLTHQQKPVGCIRMAMAADIAEDSAKGGKIFPMEQAFSLDGHIEDKREWFEPGRLILLPEYRQQGAFTVLIGAAYLYAVDRRLKGAVCLASMGVVEAFLKTGWRALSAPVPFGVNHDMAVPMMVKPEEVPASYALLFKAMKHEGVINL